MNKKGIIIRIVISIICLVGVGIGSYSLAIKTFNEDIVDKNNHDSSVIENTSSTDKECESCQKCEVCEVCKECESCDNNISTSNNQTENNTNTDKEIDYDKIILGSYNYVSSEDLIKSSDSSRYNTNEYIGAMYATNISLEYKAIVSLYFSLVGDTYSTVVSSSIETYSYILNESGNPETLKFKIKLDTLNTVIAKYFANTKITNGFETISNYEYISKIKCENNVCEITTETGLGGAGFDPQYNSKVISSTYNSDTKNYEYVVSAYYVDEDYVNNQYRIKIYDKVGGSLIKTIPYDNYEDLYPPVGFYESFASYLGDKLMTYKYIFNQNGQLVSVEKVN